MVESDLDRSAEIIQSEQQQKIIFKKIIIISLLGYNIKRYFMWASFLLQELQKEMKRINAKQTSEELIAKNALNLIEVINSQIQEAK